MEARFDETLRRYDMLPAGTRVLCACSGGADSMALLHLLRGRAGVTVLCAHFNHRLRGAESARDEAFVRNACDELGIAFFVGAADVSAYAAAHHMGLEEAARTLRYAFLERTADAQGCEKIATAHHAEDNAETVLWNLVRGCGGRGLGGIAPVRGRFIRPMLRLTRPEIEEYLSRRGIPWVTDSSNALDDNPRNRIRHHVLPLLQAENSAAVAHICAAAELAWADDAYLSAEAERFMVDFARGGALPVDAFLALPEPVGARVLRSLGLSLQRRHVEAVYALCRSGAAHGAVDLPGGRIRKEYGVLTAAEAPERALARREVPFGTTPLPELGMEILRETPRKTDEIHNSFNTFFFKNDSIRGMMFVARGNGGDTIRLPGRGCTKTLKKLFQEAKLPPAQRACTPVLYDDDGVLAVWGFGVAERCAAAPGEIAQRVVIKETDRETGS